MSEKGANKGIASVDVSGSTIDVATFRTIMASFPTGVTVITTVDEDGSPKGFTSNAVSSVSMDPPLLLVCVALTSETLPIVQRSRKFVVNYLRSGQEDVSNKFATKGPDKFSGVDFDVEDGWPILRGHNVAHAHCITEFEVEAGDHLVIFGRVIDGDAQPDTHQPLLYYRREYPAWGGTDA